MSSVVGFDIGQKNSKIAAARNRGIDVLTNEVSNRATPTLVGFTPRARALGEGAKTQESSNVKNTVASFKRLIGKSLSDPDVAIEQQYLQCDLVDVDGQVGYEVNFLGERQKFTATQVYAMLLAQLRDTASKELGVAVTSGVIAVPGWYTEVQRRAVLDAADIAGVQPLRLINDVTAIALSYGITKFDLPPVGEKPRTLAFVDIGNSDLTVQIVEFNQGQLVVKSRAFDRHLGGRDLDLALMKHFAEEFNAKYKIDVFSNKKSIFRLATAVENTKKILSANPLTPITVENIAPDVDATSTIKREEFEALIAPLIERVQVPIQEALKKANLTAEDIEAVELVGGTTRVPSLQRAIQDAFGGRPLAFTSSQDEGIVKGTAFACAMLSPVFRVREFHITDLNDYEIEFTFPNAEGSVDEPEISAFSVGNSVPSTKALKFERSKPFDIVARYADPSQLPGSTSPFLGKYSVKNGNPEGIVKVRTKLDLSGVLSFDGATAIVETPVQPTEEDPEPKPKATRTDVPSVPATLSLDKPVLDAYREKEGQMWAQDKLVKETEDRKNALEEYVYYARDKLDTTWKVYTTNANADKVKEQLTAAEDWLYSDEGEDATKSAYVQRLDALKALADPIATRFKEAEARPRAVAALREVLSKFSDDINSGKLAHLPESDIEKVVNTVASTEKWISDLLYKQDERPKSEPPVILSKDILTKKDDVYATCNPIVIKPKPKTEAPPKEEPAPAEPAAAEEEAKPEDDKMNVDADVD